MWSRSAVSTRCAPTQVPFALFWSMSRTPIGVASRRAWRRETLASGMTTSHSSARPDEAGGVGRELLADERRVARLHDPEAEARDRGAVDMTVASAAETFAPATAQCPPMSFA